MSMHEAIRAFQLAEQGFGERMQARGVLFDPALGVEAGLLAALPHLERIGADEGAVPDEVQCMHCSAIFARRDWTADNFDRPIPRCQFCGSSGAPKPVTHPPARADQESPCSLDEALNVIERWADHGNQLHGDDVFRFRAVVDRIAPTAEPAAQCETVSASELQQLEYDIGQGKYTAPWVFTRMKQYIDAAQSRALPGGMGEWRSALERALPFLDDEAGKYEDDGSNEPLDVANTIRDLLATPPAQPAEREWTRAEAKLAERKTVHEWLNELHIERAEAGRNLCLLRRLRILCDRYADTCEQLSFEICKQLGWISTDAEQPPRDTAAIYWHTSEHGGFPAIADEWRNEHHLAHASHWLPYSPPITAAQQADR